MMRKKRSKTGPQKPDEDTTQQPVSKDKSTG